MNWFLDLWDELKAEDPRFLIAAALGALAASVLAIGVPIACLAVLWEALMTGDGPGWRAWVDGAWEGLGMLVVMLAPGALLLGVPLAIKLRARECGFGRRLWVGAGWGALLGIINAPLTVVFMQAMEFHLSLDELGAIVMALPLLLIGGVIIGAPCGAFVGALLGALSQWRARQPALTHHLT